MSRFQLRPHGGASSLWDDVHALAALSASLGTPKSTRTRTRGALPVNRRGA